MGQAAAPDFIFGHLAFWIVTYVLALTAWACLGRFLMQAIVPEDSANYIWRGFRMLTGWALWLARRAIPSYVPALWLPLVAAAWLFGLRLVFGIVMLSAGLAPRITPPGAG
ncbi:MAG: YggT family protein [Acetobacteraceae bacterium]|nr:YggT family protein [Acetobacteraceae bacterium]